MENFERFVALIRKEVPVEIRYKNESSLMKRLNFILKIIGPDFMTSYTTTIGYKVFFPSREYVKQKENTAIRILAHETVHLLDAKKYSPFLFSILYLMPQIFVLGILSFPITGVWSLLFLVFALPIPSPTRFYFETRGYVINWVTHSKPNVSQDLYLKYFTGWVYYKMYPFKDAVRQKLQHWKGAIENREDKILSKVMDFYRQVQG